MLGNHDECKNFISLCDKEYKKLCDEGFLKQSIEAINSSGGTSLEKINKKAELQIKIENAKSCIARILDIIFFDRVAIIGKMNLLEKFLKGLSDDINEPKNKGLLDIQNRAPDLLKWYTEISVTNEAQKNDLLATAQKVQEENSKIENSPALLLREDEIVELLKHLYLTLETDPQKRDMAATYIYNNIRFQIAIKAQKKGKKIDYGMQEIQGMFTDFLIKNSSKIFTEGYDKAYGKFELWELDDDSPSYQSLYFVKMNICSQLKRLLQEKLLKKKCKAYKTILERGIVNNQIGGDENTMKDLNLAIKEVLSEAFDENSKMFEKNSVFEIPKNLENMQSDLKTITELLKNLKIMSTATDTKTYFEKLASLGDMLALNVDKIRIEKEKIEKKEVQDKVDKFFDHINTALTVKKYENIPTTLGLLRAIDVINEFDINACREKEESTYKRAIEHIGKINSLVEKISQISQKLLNEKELHLYKKEILDIQEGINDAILEARNYETVVTNYYESILSADKPFQLYMALKVDKYIGGSNFLQKELNNTVATLEKSLEKCNCKTVDEINKYMQKKLNKKSKEKIENFLKSTKKEIQTKMLDWSKERDKLLNGVVQKRKDIDAILLQLKKDLNVCKTNRLIKLKEGLNDLKSKLIDWKCIALKLMGCCIFCTLVFAGFIWLSSLALLSCATRMLFPIVAGPIGLFGSVGWIGSSSNLQKRVQMLFGALNNLDPKQLPNSKKLDKMQQEINQIKKEAKEAGVDLLFGNFEQPLVLK